MSAKLEGYIFIDLSEPPYGVVAAAERAMDVVAEEANSCCTDVVPEVVPVQLPEVAAESEAMDVAAHSCCFDVVPTVVPVQFPEASDESPSLDVADSYHTDSDASDYGSDESSSHWSAIRRVRHQAEQAGHGPSSAAPVPPPGPPPSGPPRLICVVIVLRFCLYFKSCCI